MRVELDQYRVHSLFSLKQQSHGQKEPYVNFCHYFLSDVVVRKHCPRTYSVNLKQKTCCDVHLMNLIRKSEAQELSSIKIMFLCQS